MAITGQVSRYTRIPELPARTGAFSSFRSTLDPWPGTYVSGAALVHTVDSFSL